MKKICLLLVICAMFTTLHAQQDSLLEKRVYNISKVNPSSPVIDASLDDVVWSKAEWSAGFTQHEPYDGKEPSQDTRFAIAFDEDYVYVAIEALDSNPESIVSRITRRDDMDGDFLLVGFDSYHDLRTSFIFGVSAGGSKTDFILSNDGNDEDETWDPVWWVKTSITDKGWIAEMKIPFSQLRFDNSSTGVWGLNIGRVVYRIDETSFWQHIPREAPGFVHLFGELHGLKDVKPRKQAEVVPYVTAGIEHYEADPEDPFRPGQSKIFNTGVDAKLGVTNSLTLDLSINPDFGQVEADPSEVNLTAYESYFSEKRPLFIEGKNIYDYPLRRSGGRESVFYSRRIGRSPHYYPDLEDEEYASVPSQTNILAAAKLSGKTQKGTSIGILESVTAEEFATIDNQGDRRKEIVEPMTNYFVSRISQDINEGNTIVGGILTSTYRNITDENLNFLPTSAVTGGIDFQQYFKDRSYNISFSSYFSHVAGSTDAITALQTSPARTFQRPEQDYLVLDTTLTSLQGFGGNIQFMKTSGRFNVMGTVVVKSPGLALNDVGFLRSSDEIFEVLWVGYNWYEPFSIFRRLHIEADQYIGWDFGGTRQNLGFEFGNFAVFKNLWSLHSGLNISSEKQYNGILRGGPSMRLPGEISYYGGINTNETKKLVGSLFAFAENGFEDNSGHMSIGLELEYKPSNRLSISAEPEFDAGINDLQYVCEEEYNDDPRYVLASIQSRVMMFSFRVNLSLTPNLTIQYWGQPFIASGSYSNFKYVTNSLADNYDDRIHLYTPDELILVDDEYQVWESNSAEYDYSFDNPDFNIKEFLSNMVLRWEYRPGSVFYLVWSQNRSGSEQDGHFSLRNDVPAIWEQSPNNVFLLKFSYRLGR